MRKFTLPVSAAAALGLVFVAAAPASADHLAEVASLSKPQTCHLGELASGTGVSVQGRLLSSTTYSNGQPKSFKCQIKNFPKYVSPESNDYGIEFTLSKRGYRNDYVPCYVGQDAADGVYGEGTLRVAGNGTGHLDCRFPLFDEV